jgi:transcriptional regulator with XRE-family HTH domain
MAPNNPDIREDSLRELREIRLRRGLSQADLSATTGVAEFTISEIESGKRANPRPSTLRRLAQGLGVEVTDLYGELDSPLGVAPSSQEKLFNNGVLEDAAQPEALQKALAVLFQGLARRGQAIVEQSLREGPSEALSKEVEEYYKEVAALHRIKGGRDIFGHDSDELAEAEAAYQEVENRIQAMLRQDIDATDEERSTARRFKGNSKSHVGEEHEADAS